MDTLTGKAAIVTGGASGIGKAVAEVLAEADLMGLVIADIDGAEAVAKDIGRRFDTDAVGVATDVADSAQVEVMVERALGHFQRIDILVNNAGIAPVVEWPDVTEANWRHVLDVNLNGAFLCALSVLPTMCRQKSGRIVNISSIDAISGPPNAAVYNSAKGAVLAMAKGWAKEFAPWNILVNIIAPGEILTPMPLSKMTPEAIAEKAKTILLKRYGKPEEIGYAIAFLCSPEADYITGQVLSPNGGSIIG
mgnify:CR=1 FL=1